MNIPDEQRKFLEAHRLAVVGIQRSDGPPSLTPVYYAVDGDDILISTTSSRYKGKVLKERPEVSICVLAEEFPFPYLTVYGTATIEEAGAASVMAKIGEKMLGSPIAADAMPGLEDRAKKEGRVVMRVKPTGFSVRPG